MCGLAGLLEPLGTASAAELCAIAQTMSNAIRHRGPDDSGVWSDQEAGLAFGFRRLAIIDLTAAGHQPQMSHSRRFMLAFNGEIYNHQALRAELSAGRTVPWVGHSDTETLLAGFDAWGVQPTLQKAVGMFALSAWDRADRRLFLARDRFGEKPLYYGWIERSFVFGSELRAIRQHPRFNNAIDRDVLALYMQFACIPAPYSIYRNIYKLQPGCVLSLSTEDACQPRPTAPFAPVCERGFKIERFWSLRNAILEGERRPVTSDSDAIAQLNEALSEAVRLQSIADVPLGAFLSGGIDSSTIVALMQSQSTRKVNTFTIGFAEAQFNEATHARAVAHHLGTDHVELYVSPQQARDVIPRLPALYSEPFADSSQIPTHLVSQIARGHVTVALSGDGGDELFGGYIRYIWGPLLWDRVRWLPEGARRTLGRMIRRLSVSSWDRLGSAVPGLSGLSRIGEKAHRVASRLDIRNIDELYRLLVMVWPSALEIVPGSSQLQTLLDDTTTVPAGLRPVERMMAWDALTYLPDDILHKVDRASMGVSLETRAPFLDHRVAELAWRLPLHMKIRNGQGKWIVRQLLYRHVPPALIERAKMGFGVPIDSWLRGPLRDWAEDLLSESRLRAEGLAPDPIRRKWTEHKAGTADWQNELWCVLMFQAWVSD